MTEIVLGMTEALTLAGIMSRESRAEGLNATEAMAFLRHGAARREPGGMRVTRAARRRTKRYV